MSAVASSRGEYHRWSAEDDLLAAALWLAHRELEPASRRLAELLSVTLKAAQAKVLRFAALDPSTSRLPSLETNVSAQELEVALALCGEVSL